ncbi:uncharacterized protein LOC124500040 [Dermatophagoides farinae]|uniref:Uncharacterized protein n=1 Tax=Dermatophagoides farinae TaxID=6954 RepID=A0A9D4P7E0_DERFA|nr:uncharacterized protein LOC124500040 [Dermatophagoides farinae]KAH7646046.1 hypothetical protein HUG17_1584 [Dermatophagoides farinae]
MRIQNSLNFKAIILSVVVIFVLIVILSEPVICTIDSKTICESIQNVKTFDMLNILAIGVNSKHNLILVTKDKFVYESPLADMLDEEKIRLNLDRIHPSAMINKFTQLNVNQRFNKFYEYDQIHSAFFMTLSNKTSLCFIAMDQSSQKSLNYWIDDNLIHETLNFIIPTPKSIVEDIDDFVISNRASYPEYFVWRNHRATGKSSIGIARLESKSYPEEEAWKYMKNNIIFQHICIEKDELLFMHPIPGTSCNGLPFQAKDVAIGFFTQYYLFLIGDQYVYRIEEKIFYNMSKSAPVVKVKIEDFINCPQEGVPITGISQGNGIGALQIILMIALSIIIVLMYLFLGWYCWKQIFNRSNTGDETTEDNDNDDVTSTMQTLSPITKSKIVIKQSKLNAMSSDGKMSMKLTKSVKSKFSPKSKIPSKISSTIKRRSPLMSTKSTTTTTISSGLKTMSKSKISTISPKSKIRSQYKQVKN